MNAYQMYHEFLMRKADAMGIPLSGTFELTSRCNLDCKMCYIHNRANDQAVREREWTTEQWLALAKECRDAGMLNLLLTGGEPLLRKDFKEIYLKCKELGFLVSVNSNGVLIDDEMIAFFKKNPPARINITLYGASAETYKALCGNGQAYDRVVHAICGLKEAGVLVKMNYSITSYNKQDLQKVFAFGVEHGIFVQAASYMFPPVRACENGVCETERMTPQESAELQVEWEQLRFGEAWGERAKQIVSGIAVPDPEKECQEIPTEGIRCRAGSSTFWIAWDGTMRLCGMMSIPSIAIHTFADAWQELRKAREQILVPAKCTNCESAHACDQCAAVCYAETESFTEAPRYMCERTNAYIEACKKSCRDHE